MAVIYLRLSKRHNELNRNEIIMTFRQGSTIYQRAGTGIFILDKPSYWDGEKMDFANGTGAGISLKREGDCNGWTVEV